MPGAGALGATFIINAVMLMVIQGNGSLWAGPKAQAGTLGILQEGQGSLDGKGQGCP